MKVVNIAFFLLFIASISYVQINVLSGKREKKEVIIYAGLMLIAAVIGSLLLAGVHLPSPAIPLQAVFGPVGKFFFPQD